MNGQETGVDCGGICVSCRATDIMANEVIIRNDVTSAFAGDGIQFTVVYDILHQDIDNSLAARLGFYLSTDMVF